MKTTCRCLGAVVVAAAFANGLTHLPHDVAAQTTGNLVANPSFEEDWINAKAEKQLISNWGEHGFGQQDLKPDAWHYGVPLNAEEHTVSWDTVTAHTGTRSLRMQPRGVKGRVLSPMVYQDQAYAGYQGEPGKDVFDSDRKTWGIVGVPLAAADAPKFFRTIRVSAWCRAEGVPEGTQILLTFENLRLSFPAGTYPWQKQEGTILASDLASAFAAQWKDKPVGALPVSRRMTIQVVPAKDNPAGTVWFDDISVEEELPACPNLAANPSFEDTAPNGRPAAWSGQQKFHFVPPSWYYVWRDWSHYFSPPRGQTGSDDLIARSGQRSFRFSVPPGDEMFCESDSIPVQQDATRPLEIGVWLKADRIRFFDLRAVDERGVPLNNQSFISGTADREAGAAYRGTFDWRYFRKFLISDHPLKAIRVRLCARGFNGLHIDDVGQKATNNQVGTLWWDDLAVMDPLSSVAGKAPEPAARPPVSVSRIDFGERLFGANTAQVHVRNASAAPCRAQAELVLTPPAGEAPAKPAVIRSRPLSLPAGQEGALSLPYEIRTLCPDWRSQYRLWLGLTINDAPAGSTELDFGTWPQVGRVEIERVYALPDEARDQHVWVNFGVTQATLAQIDTLRYQVTRRGSARVVQTIDVKEFQKVLAEFRRTQPYVDWWTDESRFYLRSFDLSSLPVHDEDKPVRDHQITVIALKGGVFRTELFRCASVPFGLVKPNTEKLSPVQKVAVRNGVLEVNGKPFFLRACLGHSWQNEPAPSQRRPWVNLLDGPDKKKVNDFSPVKAHGFNAFWPNTPYELDYADAIWRANLYTAVWYPKGWSGLAFDDRHGKEWQCGSGPAEFEAAGRHPSMVLISLTAWEGGMPSEVYKDPKRLQAQTEFADEIRRLTQRPLFSSGGYSAHKQQYGTMWDIFGPESNWDGPSRVPVTALYPMRMLGKDVAGMDFPNIFNDMAYDLIRFETYEGIIRGQRGFAQIGRWGDTTLYRGLNGELRYLEKFIFAPEGKPTLSVEPVNPETQARSIDGKPERRLPKVSVLERTVDGKTYVIATNAQPIRQGDWTWTDETKCSGRRAHTGESTFSRIYPKRFLDWHVHGYRDDKPVEIRKGDRIIQHVVIPQDAAVENLILMIDGNGCWNANAVWGNFNFEEFKQSKVRFRLTFELYRWLWSSIDVPRGIQGWRDEPYGELFERDFLRPQDFHRVGDLPPKGGWARLAVDAEALGLVGKLTTGFEFVSKGGRVWWDYTAMERADEILVLCDDALGASERELAAIRFRGCRPRARIVVPFEDRVIQADNEGTFVDDFRGENVYDQIWEGMLGDKAAPEIYYGGGYHYNHPKAAVHIYEIQ